MKVTLTVVLIILAMVFIIYGVLALIDPLGLCRKTALVCLTGLILDIILAVIIWIS